MKSPNFNQTRRQEAIALSKDPTLDEIIEHVLVQTGPLPPPHTPEAKKMINDLKPVFYAQLAQIIGDLIDFNAPPLPRSEIAAIRGSYLTISERDAIDTLDLFLRNKFLRQIDNYFKLFKNSVEIATLQKIIDMNKSLGSPSWDNVEWALRGGMGTMLDHSILCFRSYYKIAQGDERDLDEVAISMRRSSSDLINATLLNTLQIAAIWETISKGKMPEAFYDPERNQFSFKDPLDQILLTEEVKKELIENLLVHSEIDLIPVVENAEKIADLAQNTDTLGCPVGFRPMQVQKIWDQVVDQAEAIGLL